jgi:hypothetical protein
VPGDGDIGIAATEIIFVLALLVPHEFPAVTDIIPPVPETEVMEVVDEDPVQPEGNVQLYDVAKFTEGML